jgi:phosphoribosylglycinamide formyltransferase
MSHAMADTTPHSRLTVLISGNGTNLQAIIDACVASKIPNTSIVRVISNRKAAFGLQRAQKAQIPTTYHNLLVYKKKYPAPVTPDGSSEDFSDARKAYDADLAAIILEDRPTMVVCAGWMHILTPQFLTPLSNVKPAIPVINLHPALPKMFDGAGAIERAYAAFQRGEIEKTGIMIHYVIAEVDRGPPILVKEIEILKGEPLENLEERIHESEWETIVQGTSIALERYWVNEQSI